jgi:hypothetical protein
VLYHLQQRSIEHAVLPWCEMHGVAVTGYSPFGHGRFTAPHTEGGRVLAKIAETRDATPRQVALAFLTRRQSLFTIPKASTPAHAEENAGAGDLNLSESEIALIDAAFPRGPPGRPACPCCRAAVQRGVPRMRPALRLPSSRSADVGLDRASQKVVAGARNCLNLLLSASIDPGS